MKYEIDIEGLPDGWRAKEFRLGEIAESYYDPATKSICRLLLGSTVGVLIVEKIQPRRIVLEETPEEFHIRASGYRVYRNGTIQFVGDAMGSDIGEKIWREVK